MYETKEVTKMAGISMSLLKEWRRIGLICPTWPSKGKRQLSYYSIEDVVLIKTIALLIKLGLSRKLIKQILSDL